MKKQGDIWNWALLFSAFAMGMATLGAKWYVMMFVHGYPLSKLAAISDRFCPRWLYVILGDSYGLDHLSGLAAISCLFWTGVCSLVAVGIYSFVTKRFAPLAGLGMAALLTFPFMVCNSIFIATIAIAVDMAGVHLPFDGYYLDAVLPLILLILAFIRKPKKNAVEQEHPNFH